MGQKGRNRQNIPNLRTWVKTQQWQPGNQGLKASKRGAWMEGRNEENV